MSNLQDFLANQAVKAAADLDGTMPLRYVMSFGPIDIVHHHGQITFIQQLLGDTQSHFAPEHP